MDKKIKVKFLYGDNDKYDYFIIDRKSDATEIEINPESLVYKLTGPGTYKQSKYANLIFGNLDYVLEIQIKNSSEYLSLILVNSDDVEEEKEM